MSEGALIGQYRIMHARGGTFAGRSLLRAAWRVYDAVQRHGAVSLLDYGCGQGQQYERYKVHEWWGVPRPVLYDPAVARYAERPSGAFDGVICSDVLEHVPRGELDAVLSDCFGAARKFVFFSICCRPAYKFLPNGMNCHVTVEQPPWWNTRLQEFKASRRHEAELITVFSL